MTWHLQGSFSTGEISPALYGLADNPLVVNGCKELTNGFLTRYGGAKKRYGTQYFAQTVNNYLARLFAFRPARGGDYMVQITSDDGNDHKHLTVYESSSTTLVNFADGQAHDPFPDPDSASVISPGAGGPGALDSANSYMHFYTEAELPTLRAVQHRDKLFILCPTKPPAVLERNVHVDGTEKWRWGVLNPVSGSPDVIAQNTPASITVVSDSNDIYDCTASEPIWEPGHNSDTFWRLGEKTAADFNINNNRFGNWFRMTTFLTPTTCKMRLYNQAWAGVFTGADYDPFNWFGPWGTFGGVQNSYTITSGPDPMSLLPDSPSILTGQFAFAQRGRIMTTVNGASAWYIQNVITEGASGTAECTLVGGPNVTGTFTAIIGVQRTIQGKVRSWVTPSTIIEAGTSFATQETLQNQGDFVPDGHDTSFDRLEGDGVGGTVNFSGGSLATLSQLVTATGYRTWGYRVRTQPIFNGPVMKYSIGWSTAIGFPSVGVSHQDRLFLSGISGQNDLILGSQTGNSDSFAVGADADDGLRLRVANTEGGAVKWMASFQDLLFGTDFHEYKLSGTPISPTNLGLDRQTAYGGAAVTALQAGTGIVFVGRGGRNIRQAAFDSRNRDRYVANDLTDQAEHLFPDGYSVDRLAYVAHPDQLLFTMVNNGTRNELYCLTMRQETRVQGWSEWDLTQDTDIEDMAVCGNEKLWTIVARTINGISVRYIERYTMETFSDSQRDNVSATASVVTGITHLAAEPSVSVVADGVFLGNFACSVVGTISISGILSSNPTAVSVGLPITFTMAPVNQHFRMRDFSSTAGLLRRISRGLVLLRQSKGLTVEAFSLQTIPAAIASDAIAEQDTWVDVPAIGEHGRDPDVTFTQNVPYNFEIAAINLDIEVE